MSATIALTAGEISRAREVLERARSEHGAWRGSTSLLRVTAAMAVLQGAIRSQDKAMATHWSGRVIAVIEDVMGPEAAAYVSGEEGEWAA
jgi:hypothetical protein